MARSGLLKPRDPDTIYAWLGAYEADGFDGLVQHPHGGYRGPNVDDQRAEVEDRLRQPPDVAHLDPAAATPSVSRRLSG